MESLKVSFKILIFMALLTGGIYPLLVTMIGQSLLSSQANGSLIKKNNQIVGSELIGQNFSDSKYFWSRPSVSDYKTLPSGGSQLGVTSKILVAQLKERSEKYKNEDKPIPADLLFSSASGLDPHITPEAVQFQLSRIIKARPLSYDQQEKLLQLINDLEEKNVYSLWGQRRVNVLKLNLALDQNF